MFFSKKVTSTKQPPVPGSALARLAAIKTQGLSDAQARLTAVETQDQAIAKVVQGKLSSASQDLARQLQAVNDADDVLIKKNTAPIDPSALLLPCKLVDADQQAPLPGLHVQLTFDDAGTPPLEAKADEYGNATFKLTAAQLGGKTAMKATMTVLNSANQPIYVKDVDVPAHIGGVQNVKMQVPLTQDVLPARQGGAEMLASLGNTKTAITMMSTQLKQTIQLSRELYDWQQQDTASLQELIKTALQS